MILVVGGSGTTGRAVLACLSHNQISARALLRPGSGGAVPQGVAIVRGDAADPVALDRALAGVSQVFLAMGNGPDQEVIETGLIDRAAAAGVEHLVKVSAPVVAADAPVAIARMHHRIEESARGASATSGMAVTFLRPYAFMQNLLTQAATIRSLGVVFGITGDTPLNFVDARDIAAVAATVLAEPTHRGRKLVLTGPQALSYPEICALLSSYGPTVRYALQSTVTARRGLHRTGLPPWLVDHIIEIQEMAIAIPEHPTGTVLEVTGQAPRSMGAFLDENHARLRPGRLGQVVGRFVAHGPPDRTGLGGRRPPADDRLTPSAS